MSTSGAPCVFLLVETLPWRRRYVIKGLRRAFGLRGFRIFLKPSAHNDDTGEYYVEIDDLPIDFDHRLCLVGPEYAAGDNEQGFNAIFMAVLGRCTTCHTTHNGRLCRYAKFIDAVNFDCTNPKGDLVISRPHLIKTSPQSSLLD